MYRPSTSFVDRSNQTKEEKLWCAKHPTSQPKKGYKQCYTGWIKGEDCDIRVESGEGISER